MAQPVSILDVLVARQPREDRLANQPTEVMTAVLPGARIGEYAIRHHRGHYYAKCQNLARKLKAAYDEALGRYDLLLLPTVPLKATKLPEPGSPKDEILARGFEMVPITTPFDVTGHPAMAVPCGMSGGLPISMMLVGRTYDESTIYRAAAAFEGAGDWRAM